MARYWAQVFIEAPDQEQAEQDLEFAGFDVIQIEEREDSSDKTGVSQ